MNLKEFVNEINSGKYNLIFLFVVFILLFNLYFKTTDKNIEPMADSSLNSQIAEAVRQYYLSDEFIKNISIVSAQLQRDGLVIPGNLTVNGSFNIVPRGTIVAFNSNKAPSGWALCDGANGTPDLRGRFILGWNPGGGKHGKVPGNDYNQFGGAGGNQIHQLTEGELASHVHNFCANVNAYRKFDSADGNEQAGFGGEACPNTAAAGGNEPHNNMPPYIILAYIMKL